MPADVRADVWAAVSARTGIVRRVVEIPFHHDDPLTYCYAAEVSDTSRFSAHACSTRSGGAGLTRDAATASAVGEALERYCCNFYDRARLLVGCFEDFAETAVDPSTWALFSQRQYDSEGFPFPRFTSQTVVSWAEARSMVSHRTRLVPASLTYLPYAPCAGETLFSQTISTGLACRPSMTEAILYGLYECIERDAFTIYWLNGLTRSRIDLHAAADAALQHRLVRHFARPGIQYHIWDITTDIPVPTYFCIALGHSNIGRLVSVGSASHLDARQALLKSLTECAQGRPYLRYEYNRDPNWSCKDDFSDVNDFADHAQVYSRRPELVAQLRFCTTLAAERASLPSSQSVGDPAQDLTQTVSLLEQCGFDVLVVDLTTPDVRELGLHVVRVLVPGLQPLHGDHRYRFLGGTRLYELPPRLGLPAETLSEAQLFSLPHPFP
jgi:ribosomal protein S12 methylthiotransferase accessory factor